MSTISANTRWTVIPRGLDSNNILSFAVAVTSVPTDPGTDASGNPLPPPLATDVAPWNNWLNNCDAAKDKQATLFVQVAQSQQPVSIPVTFQSLPSLSPDLSIQDLSTLWTQLLNYSSEDWAYTDTQQPDSYLQSAQNLAVQSTPTHHLGSRMDLLHTASILAARKRRNGSESTKRLVNNVFKKLQSRVENLSYLAPKAERGVRAQKEASCNFRHWLTTELASGNESRILAARAAERNLYRLSDNPYNTLDTDVFYMVYELTKIDSSGIWPESVTLLSAPSQILHDERKSFIKHAIFHRRYKAKQFGKNSFMEQKPTVCPPETPATVNDFYRTLNLLSHYPELLPSLGLAYKFTVDISSAKLTDKEPFSVAFRPPTAVPDNSGHLTDPLSPENGLVFTSCTPTGDASIPAGYPASSNITFNQSSSIAIADGKLVLDKNVCKIVTRDIDGESIRVTQNANAMRNQSSGATSVGPPDPAEANKPDRSYIISPDEGHTLPMRSAGVTLVHSLLPTHTQVQLKRSLQLRHEQSTPRRAQSAPILLELEDLVRGYTVEVWRNGHWSSLTSRSVSYRIPILNGLYKTFNYLQGHFPFEPATSISHDYIIPVPKGTRSGLPDLHQHQSIVRWTGWGLTVDPPDNPSPQNQVHFADNPCAEFPILAVYAPPSLKEDRWERLRFGSHEYRFRIRPMDLLCECMDKVSTFKPAANPETYIEFCYQRSDPVHGPTLLLQLNQANVFVPKSLEECFPKELPGESMGCIVLRDNQYQPHSSRVLVPPVASFDLLVTHGVLDKDNGFKKLNDIGSFHDAKIEDDGNFPVVTDPPIVNGKSSNCFPYTGANHVIPLYVKSFVTPPSRTYLPDPMAEHLAVEMIDLSDQNADIIDGFELGNFYPDHEDGTTRVWPNASCLAIQMEQPRSSDHFTAVWKLDELTDVMTLQVGVPPGWQALLRLKCVPKLTNAKNIFELPNTAATVGGHVADWLDPSNKFLQAPELQSQLGDANDLANELALGHLEQVTPAKEILLIHAVQKPLKTCAIDQPAHDLAVAIVQDYDSPKVQFTLTANIGDRRSTGKVELIADWTDIVDSPPKTHNENFHRNIHVKQWALSLQASGAPDVDQQIFQQVEQTFPDTHFRVVDLSINAISRFEHLYNSANKDETPFTLSGERDDNVRVQILNTARLDPPRVNRVIPLRPAFWDKFSDHLSCYTSYGGAFRIYLERPWQGVSVSEGGQGELLGIALWGENFPVPSNPCYENAFCFKPTTYRSYYGDQSLEPYVTRWGADPGLITKTLPSLAPLSSQLFHPRNAHEMPVPADVAKCAFPAELPLANDTDPKLCDPSQLPYFTIAKFPVHWDEAQALWYADVQLTEVPSGFVRFGLTRYQPNSKINRECSRVTMVPFTPISAHREIYFRKENHHFTTMQICGTAQEENATGNGKHFEVELQYHRIDPFPGHRDRWETATEQPLPVSANEHIYNQSRYPVLITFTLHTKLLGFIPFPHAYRVVVREYETLYEDTPGNRGLRTTRQRLVDTIIMRIP